MQMFSMKLPDDFYQNLKLVSQDTGVSMAQIIKNHTAKPVLKKAQKIKNKDYSKIKPAKAMTLMDSVQKHQLKGPFYHQDKSNDELLYGGDF